MDGSCASTPVVGPISPRTPRTKLIIGICALDNKARSKPMRMILDRMISSGDFEVVVFGDKVILDEPVDSWPGCDFLISFFSKGFPLQKAIQYAALRRPFCVNDIPLQQLLLDRRLVLLTLDAIDVPTPKRLALSRDDGPVVSQDVKQAVGRDFGLDLASLLPGEKTIVMIDKDTIRVGKKILKKPFVEKPVNSEDHNIYIYYPGGGIRRLFRKIANKSSEYIPDVWEIRTDGSYIYEQFMSVDYSEDVKVYTIGPYYSHAETRKSPVVDGVVRRNAEGKEVRYVTVLSDEEQEIARRVCMAFGQTICGFDLLRVNGKSYVIDVNGWSFVKGNDTYYDMCAKILGETFLRVMRRRKVSLYVEPSFENKWRLKRYVSVFRHADRTPKQKLKFQLKEPQAFADFLDGKEEEVMIRQPAILQKVLERTDALLEQGCSEAAKLTQLKDVLVRKLRQADTKLQLKPTFTRREGTSVLSKLLIVVKWGGEFTHAGRHHSKDLGENLRKDLNIINKNVLEDVKIYASSERRVQATSEIFAKAFSHVAELPSGYIRIQKEMLDDNTFAKEEMEIVKPQLQRLLQSHSLPDDFVDRAHFAELQDPLTFLKQLVDRLAYHRRIMQDNLASMAKASKLHSPWVSSASFCLETDMASLGLVDSDEYLPHKWCCFDSPYMWQERWDKLFQDICDAPLAKFQPSKVSELYDSLKYDAIHNRDYIEFMFTSRKDPTTSRESLRELFRHAKLMFDLIAPQEYGLGPAQKLAIGRLIVSSLVRQIIKDLEEAKLPNAPCTRLYFTKESHVYPLLNIVLYCGLSKIRLPDLNIRELDYLTQISFEVYERRSILMSPAGGQLGPILSPRPTLPGQQESVYTASASTSNGELHRVPSLTRSMDGQASEPDPSASALSVDTTSVSRGPHSRQSSLSQSAASSSQTATSEYSLRVGLSPGAHDPCIIDLQLDPKHALSVASRVWITEYIDLDEAIRLLREGLYRAESTYPETKGP